MNDNIYPSPTTDADFRRRVIDMLLGKDWYVVDPLSQSQVNTIAIEQIKRKYCQSIWDEILGRVKMFLMSLHITSFLINEQL